MASHFFYIGETPVGGTLGYSAAREQEARLKAFKYLLIFGL